jgi:hypothetical protein
MKDVTFWVYTKILSIRCWFRHEHMYVKLEGDKIVYECCNCYRLMALINIEEGRK